MWVPKEARWEHLKKNAKQPTIGKIIDEAMDAVERDNPSLKGVLTSMNYARPALDKQRLGELIDLIGTIGLGDYEIARTLEMNESLVKEYVAIHEEFSKKENKINDGSKHE